MKTIPMQVDGEAVRVNPSVIEIRLVSIEEIRLVSVYNETRLLSFVEISLVSVFCRDEVS